MHPKGRLHLVMDPLIHRAKGRDVPFGRKGEVRRWLGDGHMEKDGCNVLVSTVSSTTWAAFLANTERASPPSSLRQLCSGGGG